MRVLKKDNYADTKNPFTMHDSDQRVYNIGIVPKLITPPDSLRKKQYGFNSKEFWFIKGYDDKEKESQIDSYNKALEFEADTHYEVMHNLACVYESQ